MVQNGSQDFTFRRKIKKYKNWNDNQKVPKNTKKGQKIDKFNRQIQGKHANTHKKYKKEQKHEKHEKHRKNWQPTKSNLAKKAKKSQKR